VPLTPDQPAWSGWRDVLISLTESARANRQGTTEDIDTEFLHELRVALRRSRSILGQAREVLPSSMRERFGDELRWLAGITGPTRDLDVYILQWDRYTAELTERSRDALQPVLHHLREHRDRAHADLVVALRSERGSTLLDTWTAALTALAEPAFDDAPQATDEIGHVVAARIRRTHQRLLADGRVINADTVAERLHELRKDAKKLRYLIECFASLIPSHTRTQFVKQMKGLQDNLGEHQDAEVHAAEIQVVATELSDEHAARSTLVALGQLSHQLEATKARARSEFATWFDDFDSKRTAKLMDSMLHALRAQR
jgi:CHAD domain-containing protein